MTDQQSRDDFESESTAGFVPADRAMKRKWAHEAEKKGLKTWQKFAIGLSIPVALILAVVIAAFGFMMSIDSKLAIDPVEMGDLEQALAPKAADPQEPYYVLVLGSDAREGDTVSRSDTIMLCRLDPETKRVSILSIPRDTKVELEGYGTQKINAAMVYSGPAGAVDAVSDFVGVNISHVVMIDFEGFVDVVDELGGVTINVPSYSSYNGIELQPGVQTLTGEQALTFVRDRKNYNLGDFQRGANQRTFLKAVVKKVLQAPATDIPGLVNSLAGGARTDLTTTQFIDLALSFQGMDADADMYVGQVPSTTATIDGVSYVITIEDEWAPVREKYVNGTVPFVDASNQPEFLE
jgi:LCP family protein required for cell wall assembly